MTDGIVSLAFALRRLPYIRFQVNSPLCERLANKLAVCFVRIERDIIVVAKVPR